MSDRLVLECRAAGVELFPGGTGFQHNPGRLGKVAFHLRKLRFQFGKQGSIGFAGSFVELKVRVPEVPARFARFQCEAGDAHALAFRSGRKQRGAEARESGGGLAGSEFVGVSGDDQVVAGDMIGDLSGRVG